MVFTFFSVLAFFALLPWVTSSCDTIQTCEECVSYSTWTSHCQWCPKVSSCQVENSVSTACSSAEILHHRSGCKPFHKRSAYDPDTAWQSRLFSAVASSPNSSEYLNAAFPGQTFSDVFQVNETDYSGYTAVWEDTCTVVVAIRENVGGTTQLLDKFKKFKSDLSSRFISGGLVQKYFNDGFDALWNRQGLKKHVSASVLKHPGAKLLITGHSIGGAIASLISSYAAYVGLVPKDNVTLYTFGMPRVGDYEYARKHNYYVKHSFRVTQKEDPVPQIPSCMDSNCTALSGPYHHGIEVYYASRSTNLNYKTGWTLCSGQPFNEDASCANSFKDWKQCFSATTTECIDDNKLYFGISVGEWVRSKRDPDWNKKPMYVFDGHITSQSCDSGYTSGASVTKSSSLFLRTAGLLFSFMMLTH